MAFQTKLLNGLQEFINQITEYVKLCVVPVGTVTMYMGKGTTPPKGWLFCNGATISQSAYPELYALIGNKLPNMNGRFPMGTNTTSEVGTSVAAGLPNIKGTFGGSNFYGPSGAFTVSRTGTDIDEGSGPFNRGFTFDASKYNSIYGASTTVQPPAIKMRYIIRAK